MPTSALCIACACSCVHTWSPHNTHIFLKKVLNTGRGVNEERLAHRCQVTEGKTFWCSRRLRLKASATMPGIIVFKGCISSCPVAVITCYGQKCPGEERPYFGLQGQDRDSWRAGMVWWELEAD